MTLGPFRSKAPVDRRLRDLDRQRQKLERDIRQLNRAMKRGETPGPSLASQAEPPEAAAPRSAEEGAGARRPGPVTDDGLLPREGNRRRFADYFSTGSIVSAGPLRQEKSIQRNKAIFMVIFVLIVGFIVVSLVL